jgi:hypothetical protein
LARTYYAAKEFKGLEIEYGIDDPLDAPLMLVIDVWRKRVDAVARGLARSATATPRALSAR